MIWVYGARRIHFVIAQFHKQIDGGEEILHNHYMALSI